MDTSERSKLKKATMMFIRDDNSKSFRAIVTFLARISLVEI